MLHRVVFVRKLLPSLIFISFLGVLLEGRAVAAGPLGVKRERFESGARYLVVEALSDELLHFEIAENRGGPNPDSGIYASPMVAKREFAGPHSWRRDGNVLESGALRLTIDPADLSIEVFDTRKQTALTRLTFENLHQDTKRIRIAPMGTRNIYGLGNYFIDPGTADGDWALGIF